MDFEVLKDNPNQSSIIDQFELYLTNRKRALQMWSQNPPHILGFMILATVSLEWVIANRLFYGLGTGVDALIQFTRFVCGVLFIQTVIALAGLQGADLFRKNGRFMTALTFFNLNLTPFLLVLPITVFFLMLDESMGVARRVIYIMITIKVLSNWRESLEISFRFSRLQSSMVMYATFSLALALGVGLFYIAFLSKLGGFHV